MQHQVSTRQPNEDNCLIENILEEYIKHLAVSSESKLLWNVASLDKSDLVLCLLISLYCKQSYCTTYKTEETCNKTRFIVQMHLQMITT